ncbi:tRNA (adenosine(37)-N6)-threonylcarbamoyltransferase complex transferase subunit TsaD [Candidatus Gottesmanbacteria bacterium]|nr:tRNA (adenosine(37)-N6)-threonylcarbamoyltransferase complex transferase subunit TsaD [Candidatus Gottesmanbacteria bacterium]
MRILGIETSCDETAAAIIEDGRKILANVLSSSSKIHEKTGGVIPEVAAREQIKYMIPVLDEALYQVTKNLELRTENKLDIIDAIAVTIGPGLIGSLLVGVETAKTMALVLNKPIIPVNHILAHIYANWLYTPGRSPSGHLPGAPSFPAIALVVSGGHTELFYMEDEKSLKWLGGTLDDAAGEAFDKTARLMGLGGYPGGPAIAAEAAKFKVQSSKFKVKLPRPMIHSNDLNFSFSGLKTAVMREVNKLKEMHELTNAKMQELAYEIQEAITDVLVKKTIDAANKYKVKSILLGGGVAANNRLTEKFQSQITNYPASPAGRQLPIILHVPLPKLCTDNAAVIASYAYFHNQPIPWQDIQAQPNLEVEV